MSDYNLTQKYKGKASPYAMRIAEYAANRIEMSLPEDYTPIVLDDGRIIIEIEDAGQIEVRCKGGERYDVLVWVGGKGELSLEKRLINKDIQDVIKFVNAVLSSFDAVQGVGNYQERGTEDESQDADWSEPQNKLSHIQKTAGITRPKEESAIEYMKSMEAENGNPTDPVRAKNNTSLYDMSSITQKEKEEAPSAGEQLLKHMHSHNEVPNKDETEEVGNVVMLPEGVRTIRVGGMVGYYSPQGVQWLPKGTIVEQSQKQWGWNNGRAVLKEALKKI